MFSLTVYEEFDYVKSEESPHLVFTAYSLHHLDNISSCAVQNKGGAGSDVTRLLCCCNKRDAAFPRVVIMLHV